MCVCPDLTGNTGSHRWGTNCLDVIGFGHQDAYVNSLSYRAFRNAVALLAELGLHDLARRCRDAAAGKGKVDNTSVVGGIDWLPTICALAGVKLPEGLNLDGEDTSAATECNIHWPTDSSLLWDTYRVIARGKCRVQGHSIH